MKKRKASSFLIAGLLLTSLFTACSKSTNSNYDFENGTLDGYKVNGDFSVTSLEKNNDRIYYIQNEKYFLTSSDEGIGEVLSSKISLGNSGNLCFLLSGSFNENVYVELLNTKEESIGKYYVKENQGDVFYRIIVELPEYVNKKIMLKIVDNSNYSHINFDDLRIIDNEDDLIQYQIEANLRMGNFSEKLNDRNKTADIYIKLNSHKISDEKKFAYHLTGEVGWINDPNGFSYYNEKINLFYQHNPYGDSWGPMHWGHATSTDFVKWKYENIAIAPDSEYDIENGCFSGSAIEFNGKYYIVYTACSGGKQTQCIAISEDGINFRKYEGNPVIDESLLPGNTRISDFRDPKVWEKDGTVYMIVSAKHKNDDWSKLLLYKSTDMINWNYNGMIIENNPDFSSSLGRMFECPDFFTLDNRDVIIISPQTATNHRNGDGNIYMLGKLNYNTGKFEEYQYGDEKEIDNGFDFYAPQTMQLPDGRRIMVAWMATWNRTPINSFFGHGYSGAMTFPRELTIKGDKLYQNPVKEISDYYINDFENNYSISSNETKFINELDGKIQDITIEFEPSYGKIGIKVMSDDEGNGLLVYYFNNKVYLDRTNVTKGYYEGRSDYKICSCEANLLNGKVKIRLLLDKFSCEIFVNDGYSAITSTVMPNNLQTKTALFSESNTEIKVNKYDLNIK
jgi:beta-fructofuranosidase